MQQKDKRNAQVQYRSGELLKMCIASVNACDKESTVKWLNVVYRPHSTRRTTRELVANPGWQPVLATSFQLVRLVECRHGTGSLGRRVNGSFGSSFQSGSPGPRVIIMTQCPTRFFLKHRFGVYLMFVDYFSFSLAHRIVAQALQYSFMEIKYNISIHHETDLDILTDLVSTRAD